MRMLLIAIGIMVMLIGVGAARLLPLHCIAEGTLVDTPSGPRPVETLRVGDGVYSMTPDGQLAEGTIVDYAASHAVRPLTIVTTGGTLIATSMHPVATDAGWSDAGMLRWPVGPGRDHRHRLRSHVDKRL